jgi:hypothetical protein
MASTSSSGLWLLGAKAVASPSASKPVFVIKGEGLEATAPKEVGALRMALE